MKVKFLAAMSMMAVILFICTAIIAVMVANFFHSPPEYRMPAFVPSNFPDPEYTPPDRIPTPPSSRPEVADYAVEAMQRRELYFPAIPDTLQDIDDIVSDSVSAYLLHGETLRLREVEISGEYTPWSLIQLLRDPGLSYIEARLFSTVPNVVEVSLLGIEDDIIYVLLGMGQPQGMSSLTEALMIDSIVLSLCSFAEIEAVQFIVDLTDGYRGRLDLYEPRYPADHAAFGQ